MIGGFDTSAGAGVLADVKTAEQIGVQALSVLTANTIQTEYLFYDLEWLPIAGVRKAIAVLFQSYDIKCVKIGVVPDVLYLSNIVDEVIKYNRSCKIIWDTVIYSSSNQLFLCVSNEDMIKDLLPFIYLLTPNYMEFKALDLSVDIGVYVFLKGGHREDNIGQDILYGGSKEIVFMPSQIVKGNGKHGSGCVLAAAITSYLAKGFDIETACLKAKNYVTVFLNSNTSMLGYHKS